MKGNSHNVDRHLLANLHEANFEEVGETLNRNWFQKHVQRVVSKYCRLHARAPALASLTIHLACSIRLETQLHITD